jgi:hypothetical protein
VQTRCVDNDDLTVIAVNNATDGATRGLRLGARNGYLLANQSVGERRFANVRTANERDESRSMLGHLVFSFEGSLCL